MAVPLLSVGSAITNGAPQRHPHAWDCSRSGSFGAGLRGCRERGRVVHPAEVRKLRTRALVFGLVTGQLRLQRLSRAALVSFQLYSI